MSVRQFVADASCPPRTVHLDEGPHSEMARSPSFIDHWHLPALQKCVAAHVAAEWQSLPACRDSELMPLDPPKVAILQAGLQSIAAADADHLPACHEQADTRDARISVLAFPSRFLTRSWACGEATHRGDRVLMIPDVTNGLAYAMRP